jgi:hypothetical protein
MPFGPTPATASPLASLGLARWSVAARARAEARGAGRGGLSVPKSRRAPHATMPIQATQAESMATPKVSSRTVA